MWIPAYHYWIDWVTLVVNKEYNQLFLKLCSLVSKGAEANSHAVTCMLSYQVVLHHSTPR